MGAQQYERTGHVLIEVPVDTFRGFMQYIAKNDLWAGVKESLKEAGLESVPIEHRAVDVISRLGTGSADRMPGGPGHAGALVTPECGCNSGCTPGCSPTMPTSPGPGDAGPVDAGAGDATVLPQ